MGRYEERRSSSPLSRLEPSTTSAWLPTTICPSLLLPCPLSFHSTAAVRFHRPPAVLGSLSPSSHPIFSHLPPASSLKSKLFSYEADSPSSPLNLVASASASNVGAKDKKIGLKVAFVEGETKEEERDQKELHCESGSPAQLFPSCRGMETRADERGPDTDLPGVALELLTKGEAAEKRGITKDEIKIVTHRVYVTRTFARRASGIVSLIILADALLLGGSASMGPSTPRASL